MGHPPDAVWDYSPRQTAAFLVIAGRRIRRELRQQLAIQALAARGDPKVLKETLQAEP